MRGGGQSGAVLSDTEIEQLIRSHALVSEFVAESLRSASYDLHLGAEYSTGGRRHNLEDGADIVLEPGQFILLTTRERLVMPNDLVGHAGLRSHWAQRGLISLFSPQIDPGFEGCLVVPLFNGGNASVTLVCGEVMFTVEFVRTSKPAAKGWSVDNRPLDRISDSVQIDMARPDFSELKEDFQRANEKITELRATYEGFSAGTSHRLTISSVRGVWLGVLVAVVALAVAAASLLFTLLG